MRDEARRVCHACREMPEHFKVADTDLTQSQRLPGAQIWVGSNRNLSAFMGWPYHGTPHERSTSLSMQPVGSTPCCSMDVVFVDVVIVAGAVDGVGVLIKYLLKK